jgi:hypothetical protein
MPVFQIELPRKTAAELAYVASLRGESKSWLLAEIVKKAIAQEYGTAQFARDSSEGRLPVGLPRTARHGGGRKRSPIAYEGRDPRLNPQGTPTVQFGSYNEVWRRARPQDAHWLYDARLHRGTNGINLLRMHEPDIFRDLKRL